MLTRVNVAGPDSIEGVVSAPREFGATKVTAGGGSETRPLRAAMPGLWACGPVLIALGEHRRRRGRVGAARIAPGGIMPVLHNRPRSRFTRHNAFSSRHVPRACRDAILSGAIRSRLVGALLHGARIPPTPGGASGAGVAPPDPAVGPIPGAKTHPTGS